MSLKNRGRKKKVKYIKCDKCKERFELNEEDIVEYSEIKYIECPKCSQEIILKK